MNSTNPQPLGPRVALVATFRREPHPGALVCAAIVSFSLVVLGAAATAAGPKGGAAHRAAHHGGLVIARR